MLGSVGSQRTPDPCPLVGRADQLADLAFAFGHVVLPVPAGNTLARLGAGWALIGQKTIPLAVIVCLPWPDPPRIYSYQL